MPYGRDREQALVGRWLEAVRDSRSGAWGDGESALLLDVHAHERIRRRPMTLLGRRAECAAIDRLLADVLAGRTRVAVLRGEAGVGKSALLDYVSDRAEGWRVARAVGVESEMELAYSGLHQLCAPMLDQLERLPAP